MKKIHRDCDEFLAIDVFKGFCRLNKKMIMMDDRACDKFKPVKKCKFCKHYTQEKEFLGTCMGKTEVYPDLLAKTCSNFEWKKLPNG